MERIRALVIGNKTVNGKRNIGAELISRLSASHWQHSFVTTTKCRISNENGTVEHDYNPNDSRAFEDVLAAVRPHIVFNAMPTTDHGEIALRHTLASINARAKVVTAEKGTAAWQFGGIEPHLDDVDLGAAVGGGNRFLYHPKLQHLRGRKVTFYGIFNATCNFECWAIGEGISQDDAVVQAQDRSIAEPAKPGTILTFKNLINGELPDKRMKVSAFYNKLLAANGKYLLPSELGDTLLNDEQADRLINPYEKRRLITVITNQARDANNHKDVLGLMQVEKDGWHISIGFVSVGTSPVADWIESVKDIDNGFLLYVDGHRFKNSGPGAGRVTVDAMLEGAYRLLGRQVGV